MGRMSDIAGGVFLGGLGIVLLTVPTVKVSYRGEITNPQTITGRVVDENYHSISKESEYQVSIVRSDTGERVVVHYDHSVSDQLEPEFLNALFQPGDLVELDVGELPKFGIQVTRDMLG